MQDRYKILTTIKDANDDDLLCLHRERDDGALLVVRHPQTGSYVIAQSASLGKIAKALVITDDGLGVVGSNLRRGSVGDLAIKLCQLFLRLGCDYDLDGHCCLPCSFASRWRTCLAETARVGSAFNAS